MDNEKEQVPELRYEYCNGCGCKADWVKDEWGYLVCRLCGYPKDL